MRKKINIPTKNLNKNLLSSILKSILKYKKADKIVLFGSRASGNFKDTSDIDIAIFDKNWTDDDINMVKYFLDERIDTPLKFDILNFCNIKKNKLKENILKNGKVIYDSGKN